MFPSTYTLHPSPVVSAAVSYLASVTTAGVIDQFAQVLPESVDRFGGLALPVLQRLLISYYPFGGALKIVWGQDVAKDVIEEFVMMHPEIYITRDRDSTPWVSHVRWSHRAEQS